MKRALSRAFKLTAVFSFILLALLQTACKDQSMLFVADPVFNPPFGEVAKGTVVTITCETEDAEIWYTKNGTDPTKGPIDVFRYTGPFTINETTTVKARAVKEGWVPSNVKMAQGTYVVSGTSGVGGGTVTPPKPAVITYEVTMQDDGNGTASATPSSAEAGKNIDISAIPKTGYRFKEWQVISGGAAIKPNLTTEPATFTMPASDVTVKVIFEPVPSNTPNLALSDVAFTAIAYGDPQPAAKTVTIANTGNVAATVSSIALGGAQKDSFTLDSSITSIAAGGGADFTVRPNAGLNAGTYDNVYITITYSGGTVTSATAKADVSFTVDKAAGAAVSGLPAVISATASSITVSAVTISPNPGGQDVEYAISTASDGTGLGTWQAGLTFSGVNLNTTTYYVYARSKENTNYAAGTTLTYSVEIFTYAVAYNGNGGTGSMAKQTFVYGLSQRLTKNVFTRAGYTFSGWAETSGGTKAWEDEESVHNLGSTPGETVNLYAAWTANAYTVAFHANGGTGTMADQTFNFGTAQNLTSIGTSITRTGYTFAGWATTASATTATYTNGQSVNNLRSTPGTFDLYAVWTAITYTVVFNANGGTGSIADLTFTYGTAKNLTSIGTSITRTGYTFAGWATTASATTATYTNGQSVNNLRSTPGTFDLYAVWTANAYTVAFHANGGTGTMADQTFNFGTAQNLTSIGTSITRTGYTFAGWATTASATTATYTNGQSVNNLRSTPGTFDLYAVWTANAYTVAFHANGGTGTMADQTFNFGIAQNLTNIGTSITRTGYTFAGWATSSTGALVYTDGQSVNNLRTTPGTFDLYAVWTANAYTVAFHANGGTGTMADQTFTYGTAQNLTSIGTSITRTGYTFAGWATTASATTATYTNGQSVNNLRSTPGTFDLYAVWTAITYTVSFHANGGTGTMADQTFNFGTAQNLTSIGTSITRTGYTFAGWATTSSATTAAYTNGQSVNNLRSTPGTFDLYAVWTATSVAVTGVSLSPTTLTFTFGGATQTTVATVSPPSASNPAVSWSTSNGTVATVIGGVVTPHAVGTATITVTTTDGGHTATCAVTVNAINVSAPAAITVTAPETNRTPVTTAPAGGTGYTCSTVSWSPTDSPFQANKRYTATVTLTAATGYTFSSGFTATINGQTATVVVAPGGATATVSYEFPLTGIYAISLTPSPAYTHTFAEVGYTNLTPLTITFTVTNTGNQPTGALTVGMTNTTDFTLSTTSVSTITTPGGTATFTVEPKPGLTANLYKTVVTVSGGHGITANFDVWFTAYTDLAGANSGSYVILETFPDGTDLRFTAVRNNGTTNAAIIGTSRVAIGTAITNIRTNSRANLPPPYDCTVQFGDSVNKLNTGTTGAIFVNSGTSIWGKITLRGKITSNSTGYSNGTVSLNASTPLVIADSYAEIENTAGYAVFNYGIMTVAGGTVTSTSSYAILSGSSGTLDILNSTVSSGGAITVYVISSSLLTIDGGTVQNTGTGAALSNNSDGRFIIKETNPLMPTLITSKSASQYQGTIWIQPPTGGATDNPMVRLEIYGGTVENTNTDTVTGGTNVIRNDTIGEVQISGGTVQNLTNKANGTAIRNVTTGTVTITGGTISTSASSGNYVVNNSGGGTATIKSTVSRTGNLNNVTIVP